jgi:hypothetical protein
MERSDIRAASPHVTPHFAELNARYIGASYDTLPDMVRYRRNFVAGGTYFFTATLVDRNSQALIDHVDALRAAMRATRQAHPFTVDAVVVFPITCISS